MLQHHHHRGFTLIELSIVIVIIGLIVAGVVGGQKLVEQAKLRSFIAKLQGYEAAINTFRIQYNAFPGDMDNATSFWSGTADGDGDKKMEGNNERLYAWQHLYLSGIVPEVFTGGDAGTPDLQVGKNISKTPFGGGFLLRQVAFYTVALGNSIEWGTCNVQCNGGLLNAKVAASIDTKLDDGKADAGKFQTVRSGGTCTDANWNDAGGADYDLSDTGSTCTGVYRF